MVQNRHSPTHKYSTEHHKYNEFKLSYEQVFKGTAAYYGMAIFDAALICHLNPNETQNLASAWTSHPPPKYFTEYHNNNENELANDYLPKAPVLFLVYYFLIEIYAVMTCPSQTHVRPKSGLYVTLPYPPNLTPNTRIELR